METRQAPDDDRPNSEGNDQMSADKTAASGAASAGKGAEAGGAGARADAGTGPDVEKVEGAADTILYAETGRTFTHWFNEKLRRTTNPAVRLGTKTATVVELRDDGRLEVRIEGADGKPEMQLVVFEAEHLDALLKKFAITGV